MIKKRGNNTLLSEFNEVSKEKWTEKVVQDLKGADFAKKLVWRLPDGFTMDPFYMAEDLNGLDYLKDFHNLTLNKKEKNEGPRNWIYEERIKIDDAVSANKESKVALEMGANGINYLSKSGNFLEIEKLISGIDLSKHPVRFSNIINPLELISQYLSILGKTGVDQAKIKGGIDFDPLQSLCASGQLNKGDIDLLANTIESTKNINGFYGLTINSKHFLNAGASASQEIGYLLSAFVEYIDQLSSKNIDINDVLQNMTISIGIGTNFFQEIAKIRAIRILFYHILKSYSITDYNPESLYIHCESSLWTKTIYDPYVNMLRNTTEAMAAVLGGCNSLSIAPFDEIYTQTNSFSSRISRNISNLMKEESYFDKVADPVAGSYYIENLTDRIVESALNTFKESEAQGGFVQSFNTGLIQKSIANIRNNKHDLISRRREVFIGTNQYPNVNENIDPAQVTAIENDENINILKSSRGAIQFEDLRMGTDLYVARKGEENRPKVYLSLLGKNKIMRKARATFATGFFGCGGFNVIEGKVSENLAQSIDLAVNSKADIVVVCGADDDYLNDGTKYATEFKKRSNALLVIAGNPEEKKEELKNAGIIDFINLKTNLIDSLRSFQKLLKIIV